ncbi:MAG TPA: MATE family efflux transporter [Methylomirabilota bacterium]|jgi:putative MATE family efflux protein
MSTAIAPAPVVVPDPRTATTRRLLEAPILPTLLRLAAPSVLMMVVQAAVTTFDVFVLGWLGPEALAGVALAFPLVMLMQTMSAGGMGGGVASAVARALGAGRRADADALVVHALAIAGGMAAFFAAVVLAAGPALFRAMGGTGGTLDAAVAYSTVIFAGAFAPWALNTLASVERGSGQMALPAAVSAGGALLHVALSPALAFGWGPFPRLGVAGPALSAVVWYTLAAILLAIHLTSAGSLARLSFRGFSWQARLFRDILGVGALGSLNTIQTNLTVLLLTGLVGPFGTFALAGYGVGTRLEYLQIPLVFGFGSALVTMVGTNMGAAQVARAEKVAWTGALVAGSTTGVIGFVAAIFPEAWLTLFTHDPGAIEVGAHYLRIVGPTYGFFGLGLALYFASQGAQRMVWPLVAGFLRLALAVVGAWSARRWLGTGPEGIFVAIALSFTLFGVTLAVWLRRGGWRR